MSNQPVLFPEYAEPVQLEIAPLGTHAETGEPLDMPRAVGDGSQQFGIASSRQTRSVQIRQGESGLALNGPVGSSANSGSHVRAASQVSERALASEQLTPRQLREGVSPSIAGDSHDVVPSYERQAQADAANIGRISGRGSSSSSDHASTSEPNSLPERGLARSSDPQTSKEAAQTVQVRPLEEKVLTALRQNPMGLTQEETADLLELPLVSISPRFRPMANKNLIFDSGHKRNSRNKQVIVWRARV